jgi:hypothetical protein
MSRRTGTGFFGPLPIFTGAYHPSAYKRGGGTAAGTLGKASTVQS